MRRIHALLAIAAVLAGCTGDPPADPPQRTADADAPLAAAEWRPEWASLEAATIRPGVAAPGCTFNWAFVDPVAKAYYIGIAAHCVDSENSEDGTSTRTGHAGFSEEEAWGTIVFDSDNTTLQRVFGVEQRVDFALIQLDDGANLQAHPQMMGYPAPVGFISCDEAAEGDLIGWHGYGIVFGDLDATRQREGVLATCDGSDYGAYTNAIYGDSGSAVVHVETNKALGIVSRLGLDTTPVTELAGATVPYILRELAKHPDFATVRLATIDGGLVGLDG